MRCRPSMPATARPRPQAAEPDAHLVGTYFITMLLNWFVYCWIFLWFVDYVMWTTFATNCYAHVASLYFESLNM